MKHVSMMPPTGPPYYRQVYDLRKQAWEQQEMFRRLEQEKAEMHRIFNPRQAVKNSWNKP